MQKWCIYCKELPERRAVTEAHFSERGLSDVRWWRGIHGRSWGLESSIVSAPDGGRLAPGKIGIKLSLHNLFQHLYYNETEEALIFEDDVVLCENFNERFAALYAALPADWDFCYVGWNWREPERPWPIPGNTLLGQGFFPWGTFCILVRKSALPLILSTPIDTSEPSDNRLIRHVLPKLKTYAALESLAQDRSQLLREWPTSLD